ncbi:hypothetical protein ALI144C_10245 [Actinosynnema sp. ALI-1.44]|uniref:hypothetical protein n=1 Tax=Actinosynnema sp. ALI-1.44 TaxID=1933779 RepID=UPI00097C1B1B|nr:hypothetical protein [Actinosynnema sp. ALI-1.44]ONI87009.1 hypothetical protein ALI144C_10245 [Actinosynnema sp. ALI-1.44]
MALGEPEILVGLAEIISERTGTAPGEVALNSTLASLGIEPSPTSVILDDVISKFRVSMTEDDAAGFVTIGDVVSYVQASQT